MIQHDMRTALLEIDLVARFRHRYEGLRRRRLETELAPLAALLIRRTLRSYREVATRGR